MAMRTVYLLCLASSTLAALQGRQDRSARCDDSDLCGRAITGTRPYSLTSNQPLSDCSKFMTDTYTIAPVTKTFTLTTTITSSPNASLALERRKGDLPGKSVPWYAWACDVERYAQVCSCAGFPPATTTETAKTTTKTITKTKTAVASPAFSPHHSTGSMMTFLLSASSKHGFPTSSSPLGTGSIPSSLAWANSTSRAFLSPTERSSVSGSSGALSTITTNIILTLASIGPERSSTSVRSGKGVVVTFTGNATTTTTSVTCSAIGGSTICPASASPSSICAAPVPDYCPGRGAGCVDLMTDAQNCGRCGNKCDGDTCQNGVCSTASCSGSSCGKFSSCNGESTCICGSTLEGTGFCLDGNIACEGLADCSSNGDCKTGEICAAETCCDRNVCIKSDTCDNSVRSPRRIFMSRLTGKEPTVGGDFMNYL